VVQQNKRSYETGRVIQIIFRWLADRVSVWEQP
jgi:hypothetical protein